MEADWCVCHSHVRGPSDPSLAHWREPRGHGNAGCPHKDRGSSRLASQEPRTSPRKASTLEHRKTLRGQQAPLVCRITFQILSLHTYTFLKGSCLWLRSHTAAFLTPPSLWSSFSDWRWQKVDLTSHHSDSDWGNHPQGVKTPCFQRAHLEYLGWENFL